jgi:sec-independent protein translocase protein TatB
VFDINGTEALVLLLLALILMGPTRLPKYAQQLGRLARKARDFARDTKGKVEGELGLQEGDIDWEALNPRHYDPRRIVQEALSDAAPPGLGLRSPRPASAHQAQPSPSHREPFSSDPLVKAPVMEEPQPNGDPV